MPSHARGNVNIVNGRPQLDHLPVQHAAAVRKRVLMIGLSLRSQCPDAVIKS
jgi:hypothetical protein